MSEYRRAISGVRAALLLCAAVATAACAPLRIGVEKRDISNKGGEPQLVVGAAKLDLTPTPGIPLGGFSESAKFARGFWTRLWVRSIYVQDRPGNALVLVSSNLMIMPNGLADRVAQLVRQEPSLEHIGPEQMILHATETHLGPGNFATSASYNDYSSAEPGFDKQLFEFLARRIAKSIRLAYEGRQKAVMRVGPTQGAALGGFFRNRSYPAFILNPEAGEFMNAREELPLCKVPPEFPAPHHPFPQYGTLQYPFAEACRAVHADIEFLRFHSAKTGEPIALALFLAAHTTVLTSETEVYSGDLFEAAATRLEGDACGDEPAAPIVALFNGAQGDVSLDWTTRDRHDLLRLTEKLEAKVCSLLPHAEVRPVKKIAFQYGRAPLKKQKFHDRDGIARRTTAWGQHGAPETGGGEDGRSILYEWGHQEGLSNDKRTRMGTKIPPFEVKHGWFKVSIGRIDAFFSRPPSEARVGVYLIGDVALVAVGSELTTMMGERARRLIEEGIEKKREEEGIQDELDPPSRILVVGFANGHVSYITTPEEYDAQHYEGAANYWGQATGDLILTRLADLVAELPDSIEPKRRSRLYWPGGREEFEPSEIGEAPYFTDDGLEAIVQDLATRLPRRDFPSFCWPDAIPDLAEKSPCCRAVPDVYVHRLDPDDRRTPVADNAGLDLVTVMTDVGRDHSEWCAIWMTPDDSDDPSEYVFHVDRIRGQSVDSPVFQRDGKGTSALPRRGREEWRSGVAPRPRGLLALAPTRFCRELDPDNGRVVEGHGTPCADACPEHGAAKAGEKWSQEK